jgi:hypothetical protein
LRGNAASVLGFNDASEMMSIVDGQSYQERKDVRRRRVYSDSCDSTRDFCRKRFIFQISIDFHIGSTSFSRIDISHLPAVDSQLP